MEASNVEKNTARSLVPLLSFSYRKDKRMNTICTVSESICQNPQFIPELCGKLCLASYFEWLVLMDKKDELCLFNMNSMEKIKLPDMDVKLLYHCVLSCEADDPLCRIAFIVRIGVKFAIMLCNPGEQKYAIHYWNDDIAYWPGNATIFKGNLYCMLFGSNNIVCGNISGPTIPTNIEFEKVIKEGIPRPSHEEIFSTRSYLVSTDNELMLVHKIYSKRFVQVNVEVLNFRVYRADFINKVWVEMENICDRTIFLDDNQGVCCSAAKAGTRENCIYFSQPKDRKLYIFDLEDQSFSTSLPCAHISRTKVNSVWILKRI